MPDSEDSSTSLEDQNKNSTNKKLILLLLLQILLIFVINAQFRSLKSTVTQLLAENQLKTQEALIEVLSTDEQIERYFKIYQEALRDGNLHLYNRMNLTKQEKTAQELLEEYNQIKNQPYKITISSPAEAILIVENPEKEISYTFKLVESQWKISKNE